MFRTSGTLLLKKIIQIVCVIVNNLNIILQLVEVKTIKKKSLESSFDFFL